VCDYYDDYTSNKNIEKNVIEAIENAKEILNKIPL
jgi:hypothetical protein